MRIMALDLGSRTIGVAVSDLTETIANGVETIRRTSPERDFQRIGELIREHEAGTIVLGYPKNMNGTIHILGIPQDDCAGLVFPDQFPDPLEIPFRRCPPDGLDAVRYGFRQVTDGHADRPAAQVQCHNPHFFGRMAAR